MKIDSRAISGLPIGILEGEEVALKTLKMECGIGNEVRISLPIKGVGTISYLYLIL
jgi:hypothetical protein